MKPLEDLYNAPISELNKIAERELRRARRNVGSAWRVIEEAKLLLARSK